MSEFDDVAELVSHWKGVKAVIEEVREYEGLTVRYHGSVTSAHGLYRVVADVPRQWLPTPSGHSLTLRQEGSGQVLHGVRPESVTLTEKGRASELRGEAQ
jgi:hypothetical protein